MFQSFVLLNTNNSSIVTVSVRSDVVGEEGFSFSKRVDTSSNGVKNQFKTELMAAYNAFIDDKEHAETLQGQIDTFLNN